MSNKVSYYLIVVGFLALTVKAFMPGGLAIAESLMALGCIGYLSFLKYAELKEAVAVKDSYDERLRSLENKLMFMTTGAGALTNTKRR